jgi:hypothetical protein
MSQTLLRGAVPDLAKETQPTLHSCPHVVVGRRSPAMAVAAKLLPESRAGTLALSPPSLGARSM